MAGMDEYRLRWVSQGETIWEPWWVADHGETKSHIPTEADHVGFANFELNTADLPQIHKNGRIHAINLAGRQLSEAVKILRKHGFIIIDEGYSH